jgi:hypothetical protein
MTQQRLKQLLQLLMLLQRLLCLYQMLYQSPKW